MIKCLFKKLKSLGSVFLMAVMLNLPLWNSALASMPNSSVQNPEPVTLADGTVLKKTVEPVAGMINKWKVTLRVEAKKTTKKSDIVLVIDTSGSMKDNRRMKEAKRAAKNFVNQLLDADHPNTRIALVPFGTEISFNPFTNYTGKQDLLDKIDHLRADGGTFTQGGIKMAASSLSNSQADFKNIVLLSDGVPTFNYEIHNPDAHVIPGGPNNNPTTERETGPNVPKTAFDYSKTNGAGYSMWKRYKTDISGVRYHYNSGNCAIAEASFAKQAGVKIHTVAVNAGKQGDGVLKQIATSSDDAYKTNDPTQLNTIFNKIATQIESAVQNATVTDTMGNGVVAVTSGANTTLSDGGKKLIWNLGTPNQLEGDKFVAETSYEIELDQDILNATADANGFYPANASATITYNKNQTGIFPVPKIKPTFVKLTKKLTGQTCYDCQFKIALKKSGSILEEHSIGAGETKTLYHPMEVGAYEAEEVGTSNNPVDFSHYRIEYHTPKQFNLAQAGPEQAVIIENIYETTSVHAKKQWNGKAENSVTVNLLSNGSKIDEVKLNEANNWEYTFSNLPKNKNGQEIVYTVTENSIENYKTAITKTSKNNFTVTNTYVSPKTNVTATKKWVNGPAPVLIEFQLYRKIAGGEKEKVGSPVTLQPGELKYTWADMPVTDQQGNRYTYSVEEVTALSNFNASYGPTELDVINTYSIPKDKVTATKKWIGGEKANNGLRPTVWFKLYRQIKDGAPEAVPGASVKKVAGNKATWNDIEQTDIKGNKYTFSVKEVDADGNDFTPENYTKKEDGLTVTNTYIGTELPEADWKLPNTGYQTRTNVTELFAVIMMAGFSVYHLRRIREL